MGNDRVARSAEEKHFAALTTPFTTDQVILDYARDVAEAWMNKYLADEPFGPFGFEPSPGACYELTRRKFGLGASLLETS